MFYENICNRAFASPHSLAVIAEWDKVHPIFYSPGGRLTHSAIDGDQRVTGRSQEGQHQVVNGFCTFALVELWKIHKVTGSKNE